MVKVRLENDKIERAAYILKAVSQSTRLAVIDLLDQVDELTVSQLCDAVGCEQSLVSHHLTDMRAKGILKVRREGKNMYYSLNDKNITNILRCITECKTGV